MNKYRVAVIGGGPSGACAAEALAKNPNIECTLFERKMDNAKPCGGAIPVCMGKFIYNSLNQFIPYVIYMHVVLIFSL